MSSDDEDGPTVNLPAEPGGVAAAQKCKDKGNDAFRHAQLMRKTTAGKQYALEARQSYIEGLVHLGPDAEPKSAGGKPSEAQALAAALYSNLAAVFLLEGKGCGREKHENWSPVDEWERAFASADSALKIDPTLVKAYYRRGQARLEDEREGLPEKNLRAAAEDFRRSMKLEPQNKSVASELARIDRRIRALEEARRIPTPAEILEKHVNKALLERGGNCLEKHGYAWGQTDSSLHVFVPARGVRGRSSGSCKVECDIRVNQLRVRLPSAAQPKGEQQTESFEIKGQLHAAVVPDECDWQLESDGLVLHLELVKRPDPTGQNAERHWLCVWEGHQQTEANHPDLQKQIDQMKQAAEMKAIEERTAPKDSELEKRKHDTVSKLQAMFPDIPVEWGDTTVPKEAQPIR
eukprot:TRINITY_DN31593_c0_g1_i2.p1 TRINITY_DN31593_c0_g1~~TRINITY_DN31593_c0_g1_i2.p1  ORF type:complete len:406 (+),score=90.04 TRINITY_DN31593_c0_g1_i2:129-1346(+)